MIEVCKLEHQLYPGVPGVTGDETLTKIPDYSSDSEGMELEMLNFILNYINSTN